MSKAKPYTPSTSWDQGSTTLAAVCDPGEAVVEFRQWLSKNPRASKPRPAKGKQPAETQEAALKRAAKAFCAEAGIAPHIEDAAYTDPETGKKENPNGVKRARRIDLVESYHKRGKITERQLKAAQALRLAYEGTMRTAPAIKKVQVDSSPKPDQHISIQVDRMSELHNVSRHIPVASKHVVDVVVYQNNSVGWSKLYRGRKLATGMDLLRSGLDAIADGIDC